MESRENKYYREVNNAFNTFSRNGLDKIEPSNIKHFIDKAVKSIVEVNREYLDFNIELIKGQKVYFVLENEFCEGVCDNSFISKNHIYISIKIPNKGSGMWIDLPVKDICVDKDYFIKHYSDQLEKLKNN